SVLSMKGSMQIAMTLLTRVNTSLISPPLTPLAGVKRPWRVLKLMKRFRGSHSTSRRLPPVVESTKAIMGIRVLGPIELWSAGRPQDLGPARERCVLAILLLTPRTIVPAETLIDRLWDTRPPAKARESLSAYLARLRASLRQAVGDSVQLAGRAR